MTSELETAKPSRVILFGAGASAGCAGVLPMAPPLGDALYPALRSYGVSTWGSLPADWDMLFEGGFESGMATVWERYPTTAGPLLRRMCEYFAMFQAGPANTYTQLLSALDRRGGVAGTTFSSLNYDCLFEYAAAWHQQISADATRPELLIKLHGSCNFVLEGIKMSPAATTYTASGVRFGGPRLVPIEPRDVARHVRSDGVPPIVATYMNGKPAVAGQQHLTAFQDQWAAAVEEASVIGLIGLGVHAEDRHVWKPLADTKARLVIVGNESRYRSWLEAERPRRKDVVVGQRFAESVDAFAEEFARQPARVN